MDSLNLFNVLRDINEKFNNTNNQIKTREDEINILLDEQKRLQGEYRVIFNLAVQHGIIDENGNQVITEADVAETDATKTKTEEPIIEVGE